MTREESLVGSGEMVKESNCTDGMKSCEEYFEIDADFNRNLVD